MSVILRKCCLGLAGIFLLGGLAYAESTLSSAPQPPESRAGFPSLQLASPEQLWTLASGVRSGIRMGPSYVVESDRHGGVWYVGVKVYHVPRGEMETATWLMTGSKSNPGLVFSIDSAAQALSIWPRSQERFSVSEADSEVWALVTALKGQ